MKALDSDKPDQSSVEVGGGEEVKESKSSTPADENEVDTTKLDEVIKTISINVFPKSTIASQPNTSKAKGKNVIVKATIPVSDFVNVEDDEETESDYDQPLRQVMFFSRMQKQGESTSTEAQIFKDLSPLEETFNDDEADLILDFADK